MFSQQSCSPVLATGRYQSFSFLLFCFFLIYVLGRGEGKEKEGQKHNCVVASHVPPYWRPDLARNPSMCPDWESNP